MLINFTHRVWRFTDAHPDHAPGKICRHPRHDVCPDRGRSTKTGAPVGTPTRPVSPSYAAPWSGAMQTVQRINWPGQAHDTTLKSDKPGEDHENRHPQHIPPSTCILAPRTWSGNPGIRRARAAPAPDVNRIRLKRQNSSMADSLAPD